MRLEIELEAMSSLCVGSTADIQGVGIDKAAARNGEGQLIIPGSTLKGRIRWECERIARAIGWETCDPPQPDNMCPYYGHHRGVTGDKFCDLCLIFGTSGKPSPLWFGDAKLVKNKDLKNIPFLEIKDVHAHRCIDAQIRPGVSISRSRRTAFNERLFFAETSVPNARFRFEAVIDGELSDPKHRALLLGGVRSLSMIGGGRSRGLGWVQVVRCILEGEELKETRWLELIRPLGG